jgi:signal transduction histidine kinase
VLEQSLSRFISPEETREFTAALREVVERGVTRNARLNPRSASGEIIPTTLNASALRDSDGKVIGAIGILRDVRAYEREPVNLNEVTERAVALMQAQLRLRQIAAQLDLSPHPSTVIGNAIQLEQVFINLLANPRDAVADAPRTLIAIRCTVEGGQVCVTVRDSGPGIPEGLEQRILGLHISRIIVEQHHGQVGVESARARATPLRTWQGTSRHGHLRRKSVLDAGVIALEKPRDGRSGRDGRTRAHAVCTLHCDGTRCAPASIWPSAF